jgi:hypothetical protein
LFGKKEIAMSRLYESEAEIEEVVRGFETCATGKTDFHHREHLTVAVWYLQTLSRAEVVERMRAGLLRFLDHHGVDPKKYSEETTVFWVDAVASRLAGMGSATPLVEQVNHVVLSFSSTTHKPASQAEAEELPAKS